MPVYLIRAGEAGPVKIGYSAEPYDRLCILQVGHYETLRIVRLFVGGEIEEAALHLRFADLRIRGEWHSFSRAMLDDLGLIEIKLQETPPPAPRTSVEPLLARVETFLRARNVPATTLGLMAVNDGKLVSRLRSGCNITTATMERVAAFLDREGVA